MNYRKTNLTDMKKVGKIIRQIRTEQTDLTQEGLAQKSGLTLKTIVTIENGGTDNPGCLTLDKICRALDTRIENILYGYLLLMGIYLQISINNIKAMS